MNPSRSLSLAVYSAVLALAGSGGGIVIDCEPRYSPPRQKRWSKANEIRELQRANRRR